MQKCLDPHEFHVSLILYYLFKYYKCNYLFWVGFCRMTILVLFAWLKLNVIVLHTWMLNLNYLGINFFLLGVSIDIISQLFFNADCTYSIVFHIINKDKPKKFRLPFWNNQGSSEYVFLVTYISILKFNCL